MFRFSTIAVSKANAQHACACRPSQQRVKHTKRLVQKSSVEGLANLLASTRSSSNRAIGRKVIAEKRHRADDDAG
jgi:hypothetical protein